MSRYLVTLVLLLSATVARPCRISEFACRSNNHCVRLDRYCDGVDDCGDQSDEPRYCTVCNRTYYGDVGKTYELQLQKPTEERLPFLCHLTFTANGHTHGELVQLIFDAFNVGRYESTALDGCPDGYMQLSELGRPFTGGSWCGTSTGYAVYYSETTTVTVSVKLFQSALHAVTPFEYKLRYKFVGRDEAVVRFGSVGAPLERGEVVPGTYCSRNFYECYRKRCRLQSPNYPGMYPRNVTCYLTLRQKAVPNCKHAMIAVRQESEHKMQIKRSVTMASMNKTNSRAIKTWKDCTGERDHLIFYDGASTDDPVLVKFCGGDWLPKVVSRGPEMLVAFHSSPFSIPLHSAAVPSPLRGFELDVDVVFTDSDSLDYSKEPRRCEFIVNSTSADGDLETMTRSHGRFGHVFSPRHTLPPNTTCTYRFIGQPGDRVWIYFISYSHQPLLPARDVVTRATRNATTSSCLTRLRIWDGGGGDAVEILLGDHCDLDPPRLCDHTSLSNVTRVTRPCTSQESYVSTATTMTMQHFTEEGTALHPATFKLRYEFIDTRLGGEPWLGRRGEEPPPQPCSRVFRKIRAGDIASPRNVFLYGRGGASNLSCVYRLEAGPGEKIRLLLHNASFGDYGACVTEPDPHTNRPRCMKQDSGRSAQLTIFEAPWRDVRVPRACFCDNTTLTSTSSIRPLVFISHSRVLEIHFAVTRFNISEDYLDIYFHAAFEIVRAPECTRRQRLRGSGGEIEFVSPPHSRSDIYCEGLPWLVEAHENKSLFLLTWGTFLPAEMGADDPPRCPTKNRVLLYSGRPARLMRIVCPSSPNARQMAIHVFSEEWFGLTAISDNTGGPTYYLQPPRPPSFLVEFIGIEVGVAALNWLEISRSRSALLQQLQIDYTPAVDNETLPPDWDCPYRCPELNACISASLWCDGRPNCPSGFDEHESHCDIKRRFFNYVPGGYYTLLGGAVAGAVAFTIFLCIAAGHRITTHRRRKRLGKKKRVDNCGPRRVPTEEMLIDPCGSMTSSS